MFPRIVQDSIFFRAGWGGERTTERQGSEKKRGVGGLVPPLNTHTPGVVLHTCTTPSNLASGRRQWRGAPLVLQPSRLVTALVQKSDVRSGSCTRSPRACGRRSSHRIVIRGGLGKHRRARTVAASAARTRDFPGCLLNRPFKATDRGSQPGKAAFTHQVSLSRPIPRSHLWL